MSSYRFIQPDYNAVRPMLPSNTSRGPGNIASHDTLEQIALTNLHDRRKPFHFTRKRVQS